MNRTNLLAALAASLAVFPAAAEMESYTVDPRHTFPTYEVNHLGYSMQRGRFNRTAGRIAVDTAARKGSADIAMETASVSTGVDKLDEHLRSEDFLNAAKFPLITFKSTDFAFEGEKLKSATGDLTINGVTRPVTFTANVFQCAVNPMLKKKQCGADLQTTIKRSDFGVKYALPMLGDDVTLRIPVEAMKD